MKAGAFDRIIELFSMSTKIDDGYTTIPGAWTSQGTRKARYIPAMRREIFEAAGREVKVPVVFEVRSDTLTRQIDETWRIEYDGLTFDVKGVQEIGRRDGLRIEAMAGDGEL
jgi:SPP1 family predicted phage head-tail adaptor